MSGKLVKTINYVDSNYQHGLLYAATVAEEFENLEYDVFVRNTAKHGKFYFELLVYVSSDCVSCKLARIGIKKITHRDSGRSQCCADTTNVDPFNAMNDSLEFNS